MHRQIIDYVSDGVTMRSTLFDADPGTGPKPGVLVFPDALGVGDHAIRRAERLAETGYVALACDLHGDGVRLPTLAEAVTRIKALQAAPDALADRATGAYEVLAAQPNVDGRRIAATGYCIGGTMALELARRGVSLAAVVGFHSGLDSPSGRDASAIRAKLLFCIGAGDPVVNPAQRAAFEAEMQAAGVDWQLHLYGGVLHSFTEPDVGSFADPARARYDAAADARSWAAMGSLLADVFN